MKNYIFQIVIDSSGNKYVQSKSTLDKHTRLSLILAEFGSSTSQMKWYKDWIEEARNEMIKTRRGGNLVDIYVEGENSWIGEVGDAAAGKLTSITTQEIINFITEAIIFIDTYNAGDIPGIIPKSKEKIWIIVPREYVKEEYFIKESKLNL